MTAPVLLAHRCPVEHVATTCPPAWQHHANWPLIECVDAVIVPQSLLACNGGPEKGTIRKKLFRGSGAGDLFVTSCAGGDGASRQGAGGPPRAGRPPTHACLGVCLCRCGYDRGPATQFRRVQKRLLPPRENTQGGGKWGRRLRFNGPRVLPRGRRRYR